MSFASLWKRSWYLTQNCAGNRCASMFTHIITFFTKFFSNFTEKLTSAQLEIYLTKTACQDFWCSLTFASFFRVCNFLPMFLIETYLPKFFGISRRKFKFYNDKINFRWLTKSHRDSFFCFSASGKILSLFSLFFMFQIFNLLWYRVKIITFLEQVQR